MAVSRAESVDENNRLGDNSEIPATDPILTNTNCELLRAAFIDRAAALPIAIRRFARSLLTRMPQAPDNHIHVMRVQRQFVCDLV